ncbi:MAG TPA: hypothetical protein VNH80_06605 [Burkholderiales bacterium]|nr:hypothetical protein [Burkholderiales bacterium]
MDEYATWSCTAMKPPAESPDTVTWLACAPSGGSGSAAKARAHSRTSRRRKGFSWKARRGP